MSPLIQTSFFFTPQTQQKLSDISKIWLNHLSQSKHGQLFCQLMLFAIDTYQKNHFHLFDAHTTTNCCHGMALHVRSTIISLENLNLDTVAEEITHELNTLKTKENVNFYHWLHKFPEAVIELASFYALTFCKEDFTNIGRKTKPKKLKQIESVGIDFCNKIVRSLQKYYSNFIAQNYKNFLHPMMNNIYINGVPVELWGEYVKPEFIRKDQYEIMYAPCLYSMQVSLAHLIYSRAKIAIISDVIENNQCIHRYVQILQGNGKDKFELSNNHDSLEEIVIVFGGCSYTTDIHVEELLKPWILEFPSLVLACDLYYPQFPPLSNDPSFDTSTISPKEQQIKTVLENHNSIKGVTAQDPTLFCLTHIYPASLQSVLKVREGEKDALPSFFIPGHIS